MRNFRQVEMQEISGQWADTEIIEILREKRNELIDKLLVDQELKRYLHIFLYVTACTATKIEFIKRGLKQLRDSAVDLSHYGSLILQARKKGPIAIARSNESFFYRDIERAIANYV